MPCLRRPWQILNSRVVIMVPDFEGQTVDILVSHPKRACRFEDSPTILNGSLTKSAVTMS